MQYILFSFIPCLMSTTCLCATPNPRPPPLPHRLQMKLERCSTPHRRSPSRRGMQRPSASQSAPQPLFSSLHTPGGTVGVLTQPQTQPNNFSLPRQLRPTSPMCRWCTVLHTSRQFRILSPLPLLPFPHPFPRRRTMPLLPAVE